MSQPYLLSAGEIIQEKFRIERALGQGTMGQVYEAFDQRLKRPVALKLLPLTLADEWQFEETEFYERFERECQTLAAVNHPNVVTIYDGGDHYGHPFLVMELLRGNTLKDRIRTGTCDAIDAFNIAHAISLGLDAIHAAGVVHRDVKPANILVSETHIKLTDFGIARQKKGGTDITATYRPKEVFGTIGYTAPEVINGEEPTPLSDQFSLGLTLYSALIKQEPRAASNLAKYIRECASRIFEPPSRFNPRVQTHWDDTVLKMLANDPSKRFPCMSEATQALQAIIRETQNPGDATVRVNIRPNAFTLDDLIEHKNLDPHGARTRYGDRILVRPDTYKRATGTEICRPHEGALSEHEIITCFSRNNPSEQKIGRDPSAGATIIIPDPVPEKPRISREQARIDRFVIGNRTMYTISDLGARNPTSLNGVALGLKPNPLRNGDVITIANISYIFTDTVDFLNQLAAANANTEERGQAGTAEHRKRKSDSA